MTYKKYHTYKCVRPNIILMGGTRYYVSTNEKQRVRIPATNDKEAIEQAKPILQAMFDERLKKRVDKLREKHARAIVRLEDSFRKRYNTDFN